MNQNRINPAYEISDALTHYGVRGMRWGVRKKEDTGSGAIKVMNETAKKYKGKIKPKQEGKEYTKTLYETADHSNRQKTGKSKYTLAQVKYKYNTSTGKVDKTFNTISRETSSDTDLGKLMEENWSEYDKIESGEKKRTYVDKDGNIWQWDGRKGDYVKMGNTKKQANKSSKKDGSGSVQSMLKKFGSQAVSKLSSAIDSGKKALSKLFSVQDIRYDYTNKVVTAPSNASMKKIQKHIKKKTGNTAGWLYKNG